MGFSRFSLITFWAVKEQKQSKRQARYGLPSSGDVEQFIKGGTGTSNTRLEH